MSNAIYGTPPPVNASALAYCPGSAERAAVRAALDSALAGNAEVPLIIGGKPVFSGATKPIPMPHDRSKKLGVYHEARERDVTAALDAASKARREWSRMPWQERAAVFRRAASLILGKYRQELNAATMLGQSKTVYQSEIDAICEAADFFRYYGAFMERIYAEQPVSLSDEWNRLEYRALEGFVYAVSPFNFTAIAANLAGAPAVMGNVVLWKPASTAILSNYILTKVYEEAGLPPGVVNFLPGSGALLTGMLTARPDFAGLHFTGSNPVFNDIQREIVSDLGRYRAYPRVVGETGGKDFAFVHPSADPDIVVTAALRGAFEYQGQKCSALSRIYLPRSMRDSVLDAIAEGAKAIPMGPPTDLRAFMNAVIDGKAYGSIAGFIERAVAAGAKAIAGGAGDDSVGWFVPPTVLLTDDPKSETMEKEIFGPVLTAYLYDDDKVDETLSLVDSTSPYALTGSVFARDRAFIVKASEALEGAAGNFYVNDKPTGAVVGRQPFGGARASGTNDKAGSMLNMLRWTSPRAVKENFQPPTDWRYPHMLPDA
jgi:1-pyrroline-5-carboxylate dehydrogenase